jgi:hypothetical protein
VAVGSKTAQGWVSRMWFLRLGLVQVGLVDNGEEIELTVCFFKKKYLKIFNLFFKILN